MMRKCLLCVMAAASAFAFATAWAAAPPGQPDGAWEKPAERGEDGAKPNGPGIRVGTFDPRAVAMAYYRSKLHDDRLKAATARHKAAKEAGDDERVRQIKREFEADQETAHRQVFGIGPYDSLLAQLEPVWPQVLKSASVDIIVAEVFAAREGVEMTEVTEIILQELGVNEETRKIIDDMNEKIRSGKYDPSTYRGGH